MVPVSVERLPAAPHVLVPRPCVYVRVTLSPATQRALRQISPQSIAQFFPRSTPSDHSVSHFPPLPRHWPASRQRWQRYAFGAPETLRSYWLQRRAAQYR